MLAVWLAGLRTYFGAAVALACVVSSSGPTSQQVADLILPSSAVMHSWATVCDFTTGSGQFRHARRPGR